MEHAIRLLGDTYTLLIISKLLSGPKRFGELFEAVGVSTKTLSQRLRKLEAVGMMQREVFPDIPPRVVYQLTEKGLALVHIIEAFKLFGEQYLIES